MPVSWEREDSAGIAECLRAASLHVCYLISCELCTADIDYLRLCFPYAFSPLPPPLPASGYSGSHSVRLFLLSVPFGRSSGVVGALCDTSVNPHCVGLFISVVVKCLFVYFYNVS